MSVSYVPYNLSPEQATQLWDGYAAGQTVSQLARRFGEKQGSMYSRIQASDGIPPTMPMRAARHLTFEDREEISRGLAAGDSLRHIAAQLGRSASTISRGWPTTADVAVTERTPRNVPRCSGASGPSRASWPPRRGWHGWSKRSSG
jgi:transposase-like protein